VAGPPNRIRAKFFYPFNSPGVCSARQRPHEVCIVCQYSLSGGEASGRAFRLNQSEVSYPFNSPGVCSARQRPHEVCIVRRYSESGGGASGRASKSDHS
jgi:hypothetical protein